MKYRYTALDVFTESVSRPSLIEVMLKVRAGNLAAVEIGGAAGCG
jgi:hypothetical protein